MAYKCTQDVEILNAEQHALKLKYYIYFLYAIAKYSVILKLGNNCNVLLKLELLKIMRNISCIIGWQFHQITSYNSTILSKFNARTIIL